MLLGDKALLTGPASGGITKKDGIRTAIKDLVRYCWPSQPFALTGGVQLR